ncbi:hypothetical protein EPUS_03984 [Endocarpon pusillum Z07020]|uniref:DUF7918 domain-containing protein n=1 Tax=Endocarpon pusillum (strain Z07020 / HMAS-L-300199) TaxID=1263415 RepID=U1HGL4_ENDPU|nr:uncharacterized protein EPUS_03984 [Endocarpon pusillum Z07020]ERF69280.1 hypothetical protein EPUS_03984 [Endocarpon pusillum Z07020]
MPSHNFIDVRTIVDGSPLIEYSAPGDGDERDRTLTQYVEVGPDQKFGVQITLQPGFDFQKADYVNYGFYLDNSSGRHYHAFSKCKASHSDGVLLSKMQCLRDRFRLKDDMSGVWKHCSYVFGSLGMNESTATATLTPAQLENIGSIRVAVYRANRSKRAIPKVHEGKMPQVLDEVSEKSLKGKAIDNNIKYTNGIPTNPPSPIIYSYDRISGEAGTPYQFNLLYRSRKILQSLGCIPRSPSPPPDQSRMLERTEEMLQLAKRQARETNLELLRLRSELAEERLRSRSASVQHSTNSALSTVASSPSSLTKCRDSSVKKEASTYQIDLTNPSTERETSINSPGSSATFASPRSVRPTPPLFATPTGSIKPKNEEADEATPPPSTATRAKVGEATEKANRPPSAGLETQEPSTTGRKRKRGEEGNEADNHLIELPPSPDQPRISEIIDLTDD